MAHKFLSNGFLLQAVVNTNLFSLNSLTDPLIRGIISQSLGIILLIKSNFFSHLKQCEFLLCVCVCVIAQLIYFKWTKRLVSFTVS